MVSIISFIIILSVLVLVHELGHFIMAKRAGILIEEFGFGLPPRLWGKKIGETIYSINWLPFGGFVKMYGEDGEEVKTAVAAGKTPGFSGMLAKERAFFNKPKRVRVIILLAGVVMNFLLGIVLFGAIYTKIGIPEEVDYLIVTGIAKDSPAEKAGIKLEDKIAGVEGVTDWEKEGLAKEFGKFTGEHKGEEIKLKLEDGREIKVVLRAEAEIPEGQGALGIAVVNVDTVLYPYWQRPFRGMWVGLKEALAWGKEIVVSLGMMFYGLFRGEVPKDVAGPVGIYQISQGVIKEGFLTTLQFVAILSINLSILNLLPIPALDGGRLLFIAIESVFRKRVKPEIEQVIHLVGIAFIIGLMILVTVNDVRRLLG